MRSDNELLRLIRDAKHVPMSDVELSLSMCQPDTSLTTEWDTIAKLNLDNTHFSADPDTIVAQANTAVQISRFIKDLQELRDNYVKTLGNIYGPLMPKLIKQLTKAYLSNPSDKFAMRENSDAIEQLAEGICLRESSEEAIFDGKRIDADLKELENGDDDRQ
jgi:phage FluMu protein gp41